LKTVNIECQNEELIADEMQTNLELDADISSRQSVNSSSTNDRLALLYSTKHTDVKQ